jgi:hypothetical protein
VVSVWNEGKKAPGTYQVSWKGEDQNGHAVASGVYLYSIRAGSYLSVRKMILNR